MTESEVRVVVEETVASEDVLDAIRRELRAYNRASNPAFYALRDLPENAPRPLHVVAYDAGGAVVGGLTGTTCLAWLDIDIMAIRGADRRRGIGRRLIRAAEAEAVARGCRWASVDTMDFQAPRFYEGLGYAVVGTFADRDGHGHTKYFLTRSLVEEAPRRRTSERVAEPRPTVAIVRAGPEHADRAAEAIHAVHGRPSVDRAALASFLADRSSILMLAVAGDDVVGSLTGHALRQPHRREPKFLLYELDVRPAWREKGIGAALVTSFADVARAEGAFEVWVVTNASNAAAMATYRRCGFQRRHADDVMLSLALV